jgi:hypothetical protein
MSQTAVQARAPAAIEVIPTGSDPASRRIMHRTQVKGDERST